MLDDLAGQLDDLDVTSPGGNYVNKEDVSTVVLCEVIAGKKENHNKMERVYVDISFELLTSATGNKVKDANSAGSVLKSRIVFPAKDMSEAEFKVKGEILKKLYTNLGFKSLKEFTSLEQLATKFKGLKLKIAIGLDQDFYIDKVTNEPKLTTYSRYRFSTSITESLNVDLNKLAAVKPMSQKKQLDYNNKRAYWEEQNASNVPAQQGSNFGGQQGGTQGSTQGAQNIQSTKVEDLPFSEDNGEDPFAHLT